MLMSPFHALYTAHELSRYHLRRGEIARSNEPELRQIEFANEIEPAKTGKG